MRAHPISPALLTETLADRIARTRADPWTRVLIDGAPPARPEATAEELVAPLRLRGRPVARVSADDFLRPASLRLEFGREDPDVLYEDWLDVAALNREVLTRKDDLLPALWDRAADRAARRAYLPLPPGGVVLVDGALLLGRGLAADLTVHLWLSPGALARRTAPADRWALPAYARHEEAAREADLVIRMDDPRHPALVIPD
jgi:hypothetical protein